MKQKADLDTHFKVVLVLNYVILGIVVNAFVFLVISVFQGNWPHTAGWLLILTTAFGIFNALPNAKTRREREVEKERTAARRTLGL